jgi:hypothetical protein
MQLLVILNRKLYENIQEKKGGMFPDSTMNSLANDISWALAEYLRKYPKKAKEEKQIAEERQEALRMGRILDVEAAWLRYSTLLGDNAESVANTSVEGGENSGLGDA